MNAEAYGMGRSARVAALLALFLAAAAPAAIPAQEPHLRPPTEAERAVLNHYRQVIREVLDTFQNDDWNQNVDFDVEDNVQVSDDRDVPLNIDELIQRTYTVRPGSTLFNRDFKPTMDRLTSTHDPTEMAAIAKQLKMNKYSVEVHFDVLSVGVKPPPETNADLHLPGVALAYRVNNYKFDKGASVVLLFGDWKSAVWRAQDKMYHYKFQHAFRQPVIENVVIQLDGSPERIEELLRGVRWQRVNDALTR